MPEDRQQRRSSSASASSVDGQRGRRCRAGGATSTGRPTWSRKSPGSSATTRSRRRRCRARRASPGRPRPASQLVERQVRRDRRGARARRGGHLELHLRERSRRRSAAATGVLANPISEEMKVMRPSLLPGLIAAARRNLDRGASVGPAVRGRPPLSRRRRAADARRCCSPATSGRAAGSRARRRRFDAFDAKAEALALLEAAGAPVANLQVLHGRRADLASRAARRTLGLGPKTIARRVRRASPARSPRRSTRRPDGRGRDLPRRHPGAALRAAMRAPPIAPPALQAVTRDFAFLVPADLPPTRCCARSAAPTRRRSPASRLFDRFEARRRACRWRSK